MASDPDIYRAAKLMIDQHDANASLHAAERADQLLDAGDMIGATTSQQIFKAIEELGRGRRETPQVLRPYGEQRLSESDRRPRRAALARMGCTQ